MTVLPCGGAAPARYHPLLSACPQLDDVHPLGLAVVMPSELLEPALCLSVRQIAGGAAAFGGLVGEEGGFVHGNRAANMG